MRLEKNFTERLLVIRRDNIGDLICTTPLFNALRRRYPEAYIAVLCSSYNAAVLNGNPDINEIFVFPKRQQRSGSLLKLLWQRFFLIYRLRQRRFDYAVLANGGLRYALYLKAKKTLGFRERDLPESEQPDIIVPLENRGIDDHEVVKMAKLAHALKVEGAEGPTCIFPDESKVTKVTQRLRYLGWSQDRRTIAVHISSRQISQRWPEASFIALVRALIVKANVQILLFWSPGDENNALHPGDDGKAQRILDALSGLPVFPCATAQITDLVAGLSLCEQMICSDGGAMHVAAALKKSILCFFNHPSRQWYPWHVPYILLHPATGEVADISVDEAFLGFLRLQENITGEKNEL